MSKWAKANPERHRENVARWRANNLERAQASQRLWYQNNKDHIKAVAKARHDADPETWKALAAARMRRRRELYPHVARETMLRGKYRLTLADYQAMREAQDGVCAVCSRPENARHRSGTLRQLAVDHDHNTGLIRGLLCSGCNIGIGRLGDDPTRLDAAARYLRSHLAP